MIIKILPYTTHKMILQWRVVHVLLQPEMYESGTENKMYRFSCANIVNIHKLFKNYVMEAPLDHASMEGHTSKIVIFKIKYS